MPKETLCNLENFILYKDVAEEYLYYRNITVVKTKDIILDISKKTDYELIEKLQEKN